LRFLLLNQCFYPDVVSTAQHLTDLARELSSRGHDVTVVAGDRGYDNPSIRFPRYESCNNIEIHRLRSLSLGKETKLKRALNFGSFLVSCALRLLTLRRFDVVVALTSPPLISFLASLFVAIKGGRFCFWVMDLNPDEAIAAGWLKENSLTARSLKRMLRHSLKRADRTIVLDRFMRERLLAKGIDSNRVSILPPWSHDDSVSYSSKGRSSFRAAHGLEDKFVVMYSGNHSPCHPLDTLLNAALAMAANDGYAFCFVGGGSEQNKVRDFAKLQGLGNILCLPYQPLEKLSSSLSAADLHVVVLGDKFAGIVHPCKVYNIMSVGAPMLYIGPQQSHIMDLAADLGPTQLFTTQHGDVDGVVKRITDAARVASARKNHTHATTAERFSKHALLPQMMSLLEFNNVDDPPILQATQQPSVKAQ
jgi:colanic acid biosynthesis glycosyl transferase WcaI